VRDDGPVDAPEAPSLEELMRQTATGDQAAFATLYDRLAPRVHGLVVRILRDHAQSE
jgi:RNA polymerase sigma-70 factor (ECF subfamily)